MFLVLKAPQLKGYAIFEKWEDCCNFVGGENGGEMIIKTVKDWEDVPKFLKEKRSFKEGGGALPTEEGPSQKKKQKLNEDDSKLIIYTDGSCLSNGRKSAQAGWGVYFGEKDRRNKSGALKGLKQTNQRAELTAIIEALKTCVEESVTNRSIEIRTDSEYCKKALTIWMPKTWKKNGWMTAAKKPVENQDLFLECDNLLSKFKNLEFTYVKGHSGDKGNDAVDRLAVSAAVNEKRLGR